MNVLVAGGTGFLGAHIVPVLETEGTHVTILTRQEPAPPGTAGRRYVSWDGHSTDPLIEEIRKADVIMNLSGASIGAGRWTARRKRLLSDSRIDTTRTLVAAIAKSSPRPSTLLNMSAVGYYGECGDDPVTEGHPSGEDFLAALCREWEAGALRAEEYGVRVLLPRMAVVLAAGAGVLKKLMVPYKFFLGGALGPGTQWFPWVHVDDAVAAMLFAVRTEEMQGPFNVASPGCVTTLEFARELGGTLHRPSALRVPGWILSLVLGEMAETILVSQKILPHLLQRRGFTFQYPSLRSAFAEILAS